MITRFLYQLDIRDRKTITSIVENDKDGIYDPSDSYLLTNSETYTLKEDEHIVKNNGKLVYCVFDDKGVSKYVKVSIFKDAVRLELTDNIGLASLYGRDFFASILDFTNYFELDDCEFKYSGISKNKRGDSDVFENFFSKAKEDSYVKITKDEKAYFLTKDADYHYVLTEEFKNAVKISPRDIRKILVLNDFIDENTTKQDVSIAQYKSLRTDDGFIYGGFHPIKVTFVDDVLTISDNFTILPTDRLINSEDVFLALKDASYLMEKEKSGKESTLEINGKYIKQLEEYKYQIVSNPSEASKLDDYYVEIIKSSMKLFGDATAVRKNKAFYLYNKENEYCISLEPINDYDEGKIIEEKEYTDFEQAFDQSFNMIKKNEGIILKSENSYVKLTMLSKLNFKIEFTSGYEASVFSVYEANSLLNLLKLKVEKRELRSLISNDVRLFNMTYGNNEKDFKTLYSDIMADLKKSKHRILTPLTYEEIKTESEKGSLEYLRQFFIKDVLDYQEMFKEIFDTKKKIENILIVDSKLNLEIVGLMPLEHKVNLYTITSEKMGYMPPITIDPRLNYKEAYRLKFGNLPAHFVDKFDVIVFGKGFKDGIETVSAEFDALLNNDKEIIFANIKPCNIVTVDDSFSKYFKTKINMRRKFFNHDEKDFKEIEDISNETINYMINNVWRCHEEECNASKINKEKKSSYYSLILKNSKGELKDLL